MLLAKMERIMKQKNTLDNHNDFEVKSLNFTVRKREMIKITSENLVRAFTFDQFVALPVFLTRSSQSQAILRRIQAREPCYSHTLWEDEARRQESYLRNICEYPLVIRPGTTAGDSPGRLYALSGALDDEETADDIPPPPDRLDEVRERARAAVAAARAATGPTPTGPAALPSAAPVARPAAAEPPATVSAPAAAPAAAAAATPKPASAPTAAPAAVAAATPTAAPRTAFPGPAAPVVGKRTSGLDGSVNYDDEVFDE
jgi:hypothetical protein